MRINGFARHCIIGCRKFQIESRIHDFTSDELIPVMYRRHQPSIVVSEPNKAEEVEHWRKLVMGLLRILVQEL